MIPLIILQYIFFYQNCETNFVTQTVTQCPSHLIICSAVMASTITAGDKGPKAYFTDRLTKELRKAFSLSPEFVLIIESDNGLIQTKTFHFHGIVIVPDEPDSFDKMEAAFKRAVGEWDASG